MIGRRLGLITSSNFYVPQVNLPGSMASFVTPAAIPVATVVPAATSSPAASASTTVGGSTSFLPLLVIGGAAVLDDGEKLRLLMRSLARLP